MNGTLRTPSERHPNVPSDLLGQIERAASNGRPLSESQIGMALLRKLAVMHGLSVSSLTDTALVKLWLEGPPSGETVTVTRTEQVTGITREEVEAIVDARATLPREIVIRTVTNETLGKMATTVTPHKLLARVVRYLLRGKQPYLMGPAGSGKSTLAEQCADALSIALGISIGFEFTGAVFQEHKLTGFIDAQGRIVCTAFRRAWENGNCVFFWDEIDRSNQAALAVFHAALAGQWADFPDGKIKRGPNLFFISAGNTAMAGATRQHSAGIRIDGATKDRWSFIQVGYDEEMETRVAVEMAGDAGKVWANRIQAIRRAALECGEMDLIISPRATFGCIRGELAGDSVSEALASDVWRGEEISRPDVVARILATAGVRV